MDIKSRRSARRRSGAARYPNLATYLAKTHDTQARLADAVDATQGQISRIIRGLIVPRPALALRLANHCHVPVDSFVQNYQSRAAQERRTSRTGVAHDPARRPDTAADDSRR